MNGLPTTLYTAAFALCLFSAGVLGGRKTRAGYSLRYFTWFLALQGAAFVLELLMVHPATPLKSLWVGMRLSVALLVAPCLWLAIKEVVEGVRPRITELGRTQLSLIALGATLTLPLIASAHLGTEYRNTAEPIGAAHAEVLRAGMLGCVFIFAVQVPLYLWQCRGLLTRLPPGALPLSSRSVAWLRLPLFAVLTTWVLGLARTLLCATAPFHETAILLVALIEVAVTVGSIFVVFRGLETTEVADASEFASPSAEAIKAIEAEASNVGPTSAAAPVVTERPVGKYAKSVLDLAVRERIRRKLVKAMEADALYRDSLLNLRTLSSALKENAHYVSQVINQDLATTFYDLVNRHRIDEAKRRLTTSPDENILEIALAVGFNSKSTFNTAFRRHAGKTPSEFRADQLSHD